MSLKLNLKKVKETAGDGTYAPITEGRYDLVVDQVQKGESQNGNAKLDVTFTVLGPSFANRKVWATFSLVEKAQIYLVRFIEALGLDDLIAEEADVDTIARTMVGKKVNALIEPEVTNNGNPRSNVSNYIEYSGDEAGPNDQGKAPAPEASSGSKQKLFS